MLGFSAAVLLLTSSLIPCGLRADVMWFCSEHVKECMFSGPECIVRRMSRWAREGCASCMCSSLGARRQSHLWLVFPRAPVSSRFPASWTSPFCRRVWWCDGVCWRALQSPFARLSQCVFFYSGVSPLFFLRTSVSALTLPMCYLHIVSSSC